MGPPGGGQENQNSAGGIHPSPMRSQTDVSLTQAARHSVTGDPHAIVGHIQNAFFVGDSEPDRGGGSSGMPHDVGQQFANHTENDGVDPTTYWVINIGGDLDTRTLSGRGRQLFYRRPNPTCSSTAGCSSKVACRSRSDALCSPANARPTRSSPGVTASNSMSS